jgi:Holliday junction resolvase RusA-like endonuclease
MRARIYLPGIEVQSKQHSRSYSRTGRTFTNHTYAQQRDDFGTLAKAALRRCGWSLTEKKCSMSLSYRGRFDLDNAAGFVMDALQGIAYLRDSQIVAMHICKRPAGDNGVGIVLETIDRWERWTGLWTWLTRRRAQE